MDFWDVTCCTQTDELSIMQARNRAAEAALRAGYSGPPSLVIIERKNGRLNVQSGWSK